jgi:hypothetical protein
LEIEDLKLESLVCSWAKSFVGSISTRRRTRLFTQRGGYALLERADTGHYELKEIEAPFEIPKRNWELFLIARSSSQIPEQH